LTCATLDCSNLNIGGESTDTKIANLTSAITQADLDTKQNILTSSINILTKRIDVSDKLVITGTQPTLYLKYTNGRSGIIHMNDNIIYFLSGGTNTESWSQINGRWPLQLNTSNNSAQFGGNIDSPGEVGGATLRVNIGNSMYWQLQTYNDENLGFYKNKVLKGFIEDDGGQLVDLMHFTGQHRCFIKDIPYSNTDYIGRIVCAN